MAFGYYPYFQPAPVYQQPQMPLQAQNNQTQPSQSAQQPLQAQIQNNGFISVPSEEIVSTYPVAPGNCVTFKIEGKPIVMEKSMGFSQLESPKIERYRLVKEEPVMPHVEEKMAEPYNLPTNEIKSEIQAIWGEIKEIRSRLNDDVAEDGSEKKAKKKKKGVAEDDAESN